MADKRKRRKSTETGSSQLAGVLTVRDLQLIYASDAECMTRRTSSRTGWTCRECKEGNMESDSKCTNCGTRHYSE
jgi:hypothetical protein